MRHWVRQINNKTSEQIKPLLLVLSIMLLATNPDNSNHWAVNIADHLKETIGGEHVGPG